MPAAPTSFRPDLTPETLLRLAARRNGHFLLESGLHTDSWLDLDQLFLRPSALQAFTAALAEKLARHDVDMVCGPLSGGAFLAQSLAERMDVAFAFAERWIADGVARYGIAPALRAALNDKRIALVDDAISAGSAVSGTLVDLEVLGGRVVVLGALILVGDRPHHVAAQRKLPLEWLVKIDSPLWDPAQCPLCREGIPLTAP